MKRWVDSSTSLPDAAGLKAAREAGLYGWCGYLASKAGVKLYAPWPKEHFDRVKAAGLRTGAYVSGWDDPVAVSALAADWGIDLLILDVEAGIRGDGTWVPGWLSAAGAGLYGASSVHSGRTAACHILANYPGGADPQATWPNWLPRPAGPCGWQWHGSTGFYGATVDLAWFEDAIGAPQPQPKKEEEDMSYFMVPDSNPEGIIWLCRDLAMGPKRRVFNPAEGTAYAAVMTDKTTHTIPRFVFDAMPIETVAAIQPAVADVKAAVSAIQTGTPVAHTHPITANTGDPYK